MSKNKELAVYLSAQRVGTLRQSVSGKLAFEYHRDAKQILSLSLPLEQILFEDKAAQPFFGGLLPESATARRAIGRNFGIKDTTFNILKAIGHECAGAVSIVEPDVTVPSDVIHLAGRVLSKTELATHIRDLPKKPLFVGVDGLKLSLAGAQDKAAICFIDGAVAIPEPGSVSTYLLKPEIHNYAGSVQNEYFCMRLATRMGWRVPQVIMQEAEGLLYLLVQRYDRTVSPEGNQITRIHQEDFCQALGILSTHKYQNEGGPSLEQCFKVAKQCVTPVSATVDLWIRVIFNYLIGNHDAHGKNFSLLHLAPKRMMLAPFYDVMSTAVYPNLSRKMAMSIAPKHYDSNYILPRHWEKLCKTIEFNFTAFTKMLEQVLKGILPAADAEYHAMRSLGFDMSIVDKIIEHLNAQVNKTKTQFEF